VSREWNLDSLEFERLKIEKDTLASVSDHALLMMAPYEDVANPDWDIESLTAMLVDGVLDPASNFDDANNDISNAAAGMYGRLGEDPCDTWNARAFTVSEVDSYWRLSGIAPHFGWGRITDIARQRNLMAGLILTAEAFKPFMLHMASYATLIKLASYLDADGMRRTEKPLNRDVPASLYKMMFSTANPNTDILGLDSAVLNDADVVGRKVPIFKPWLPLVNGLVGHFTGIHCAYDVTTIHHIAHEVYRFLCWSAKELTTTWRPWLDTDAMGAYDDLVELANGIETNLSANVLGKYRGKSLVTLFANNIQWVDLMSLANETPTYGNWFLANVIPGDAVGLRVGHDFGAEHKAYSDSWVFYKMRNEWNAPPMDMIVQIMALLTDADKSFYEYYGRYLETINMAPEGIRYADVTAALATDATSRSMFDTGSTWEDTYANIVALDHIGDGRIHYYDTIDLRFLDPMVQAFIYHKNYSWFSQGEKPVSNNENLKKTVEAVEKSRTVKAVDKSPDPEPDFQGTKGDPGD
jgi:hypothetical protein